jgi:hypothetical protein
MSYGSGKNSSCMKARRMTNGTTENASARGAPKEEAPRVRGLWNLARCALVVPVVTTDYEPAVAAVMMVPAMVPPAVMFMKPNARPVVAVTIVAMVATDVDADAACIRKGRGPDHERRNCRQGVGKLSHIFLLRFPAGTNAREGALLQELGRNFLKRAFIGFQPLSTFRRVPGRIRPWGTR